MRRYGESKSHEAQKTRIGKILSDKGWTVHIDSYPFTCKTEKGERTYWPDVYAESPTYGLPANDIRDKQAKNGAKRIIVEIQGKGGHNTKLAFSSDNLRIKDIRTYHGYEILYVVFGCRNKKSRFDIRNWTDGEIWDEIEAALVPRK